MKRGSNEAVSPVVGIMLMLVVTIIIAAVVSAFSGGIGQERKTPQATISATYSQSTGMIIYHEGGDTLATPDLKILVIPGRTFNTQDRMNWYINKSAIQNPVTGKYWPLLSNSGVQATFSPGDQAYISYANLSKVQERSYFNATNSTPLVLGSDYQKSSFGFAYKDNQGKTIIVELIDGYSGKPIATTETVIKP